MAVHDADWPRAAPQPGLGAAVAEDFSLACLTSSSFFFFAFFFFTCWFYPLCLVSPRLASRPASRARRRLLFRPTAAAAVALRMGSHSSNINQLHAALPPVRILCTCTGVVEGSSASCRREPHQGGALKPKQGALTGQAAANRRLQQGRCLPHHDGRHPPALRRCRRRERLGPPR